MAKKPRYRLHWASGDARADRRPVGPAPASELLRTWSRTRDRRFDGVDQFVSPDGAWELTDARGSWRLVDRRTTYRRPFLELAEALAYIRDREARAGR